MSDLSCLRMLAPSASASVPQGPPDKGIKWPPLVQSDRCVRVGSTAGVVRILRSLVVGNGAVKWVMRPGRIAREPAKPFPCWSSLSCGCVVVEPEV